MSRRDIAVHATVLTASAAILHFAWEMWQCTRFFVHMGLPPTLWAMLRATTGDMAMTWLVQVLAAASARRWLWPAERWPARVWMVMLVSAIVLWAAIEAYALRTGRWAYSDAAPLLPGTPFSVVPLLQLALLFPATFGLTGWAVRWARS